MRILYCIVCLGFFLQANAQFRVIDFNLKSNDIIYDSHSDRIYATLTSDNGSLGNSIAIINPNTETIDTTIFIGSEPNVLAVSDDGLYLYIGFLGSSTVRRFNLQTLTPEIQINLGLGNFQAPYFAQDIEVMPSNPNVIAVSRKVHQGGNNGSASVAIFNNGVMMQDFTNPTNSTNSIAFITNDSLAGYNSYTSSAELRKLWISETGVHIVESHRHLFTGHYTRIIDYINGKVFSSRGHIVDFSTSTPFLFGQFPDAEGPFVYDNDLDLICYANYKHGSPSIISLKRYHTSTFLLQDEFVVSYSHLGTFNGTLRPINVTKCGTEWYAFNTQTKVHILKKSGLNTDEISAEKNFTLYPNPSSDRVFIDSEYTFSEIQILDLNGKCLRNYSGDVRQIDISDFAQGMYILKFVTAENLVMTRKIVKA